MDQEQRPNGRRPRKHYTEEFKRSVIDHWINSGKTGAQVAQEFGVKIWNLRDWKREFAPSGSKPVDAPVPKTPEEMSREIQQLRKELARVIMQRDILKKTMGILSEE
jgi:transposase